MLSSKNAFSRVPARASSSIDVHGALVSLAMLFNNIKVRLFFQLAALNKSTRSKARCPGFTFAEMPFRPVYPQLGTSKRYIYCYAPKNGPHNIAPSTELGQAEFFIDVNPDPAFDFFNDAPPGCEEHNRASHSFVATPDDESAKKRVDRVLGQHVDHIVELLARQHRIATFSVSVFGSIARLIRWDCAGAVSSVAFDIHERPDLLCDFLWRFSQTSHTGRGHDVTVEGASPDEESCFLHAITRRVQRELNVEGQELRKMVSEHYVPGHAVALHVFSENPHSSSPRVSRFIASRPVVSPTSLTGRCTRGYWALDPSTDEVVFVKDTWRSLSLLETEGMILSRMGSRDIRNIPGLVCHGDVPVHLGNGQCGRTCFECSAC